MIKEAIQYLTQELAPAKILNAAGINYSREPLEMLASPEKQPESVGVHTLQGVADYLLDVRSRRDCATPEEGPRHLPCLVTINSPSSVAVLSDVYGLFAQRDCLLEAKAILGDPFPFGRWLDSESFIIQLLSKFVKDDAVTSVLSVIGNLVAEEGVAVEDDGYTQQVTVRKGVRRGLELLPSPLELRPFRTFPEVEQPSSRYILRVRREEGSGPEIALFEVSDKHWELEAIDRIKAYLVGVDVELTVLA